MRNNEFLNTDNLNNRLICRLPMKIVEKFDEKACVTPETSQKMYNNFFEYKCFFCVFFCIFKELITETVEVRIYF